jgi:cytochrome P450
MTQPAARPSQATPADPVSATAEPHGQTTGAEATPLYGDHFTQQPQHFYQELRRRHGAVAPVLLDGDIPAWLVLSYREILYVTRHPELFGRDSQRWHAWDRSPSDWPLLPYVAPQPTVLFAEGTEHRRRAGAISDALAAVDKFELRRICQRIADGLIGSFSGRGEADLVADYARRIPLGVTAELFGFPDEEIPALIRDISLSLDLRPGANEAHQRTMEAMHRLVRSKRAQPGRDVATRMLQHPAGLTDDQTAIDLLMIAAAAQQPTANWIGNTLRLMITDDRFAMSLLGGRRSTSEALNEVLWEDTPTQCFIGRWATRDLQLAGNRIAKGDLLILGLAAANNDPEVRPHEQSGNYAHMSFSHGEHSCPYPAPVLAEIIARTTVEAVLYRLPDIALAVDPGELRWHPSVWMRGLVSLPVRFSPTSG